MAILWLFVVFGRSRQNILLLGVSQKWNTWIINTPYILRKNENKNEFKGLGYKIFTRLPQEICMTYKCSTSIANERNFYIKKCNKEDTNTTAKS